MITKHHIFPILMLLLNLGAAIASFWDGDWKRGIYWLGGCVCIAAVSF